MGKPVNVEIEADCDFDLHFDIWQLSDDTFEELFKVFPRGAIIAERALQLKYGSNEELHKPLNKEELLDEVKNAISLLQQIEPCEELNNPKITFVSGNSKLRLESLSSADSLSVFVDDEFSTYVKNGTGEVGYSSYFFLSEPMYRLASSYTSSHWILWSLTNLEKQNPYTPLMKLYNNRCDAAITNDGVLLFQLNDD